jgi:WD40 repeat protein
MGVVLCAGIARAQSGTWTLSDAMDIGRDAHAAILLGDHVLIIGGRKTAVGITTTWADQFVLGDGLLIPTGAMRYTHSFCPVVRLNNGKVLVPGGFSSSFGTIRASELYDPKTGSFSTTGRMNAARELHTGTLLPDGKVLVTGGFSNNRFLDTAELYDANMGTFSYTGSMSQSRFGHTATPLTAGVNAGKILITGGRTANNVSLQSTEIYDPMTGMFAAGPDMKVDRYRHTATLLHDGRILFTGGYSSTQTNTVSTAEIYDPVNNAFTVLNNTGMTHPRMDHTATLLKDGRVLVAGGWNSVESRTVASADIFDPATNIFTPTASMSLSRHEHTATLLPDGRVLVIGGLRVEPGVMQTLSGMEIYMP